MAWRCGSLPRAVMSSARSSVPRIRPSPLPPPLHSNRLHCRRPILSLPTRPIGALGCTQSLMPLHSTVAATLLTSHISFQARARCELSQELLVNMLRQQFRRNKHETDPENIQKMKDDPARGLINHILYDSERLPGRKFSKSS